MTVNARLSCGLVLTVAAAVLSHVGAASALSCAPGTVTPEQVVAGQVALSDGSSFFDHYDVAIIGTVLDIETETEPGDRHGRTTVTFAVHATFGEPPAAEVLKVSQGDPGWMTGYAFQSGRSYFVPVKATGPQGQSNYSFVCDPIFPLEDSTEAVARLGALAEAGGRVSFFEAGRVVEATTSPPNSPSASSEGASAGVVTGGAAAATIALVAGFGSHRLRRRRRPATELG